MSKCQVAMIATSIMFVIMAFASIYYIFAMPTEWEQIKSDMTINEVRHIIGDRFIGEHPITGMRDGRDLKKYDLYEKSSNYICFKYSWRLIIYYDVDDHIVSAYAYTLNSVNGLSGYVLTIVG